MYIYNICILCDHLPISGPNRTTKIPLPTICQPNAAGSFSKEEYSDTVNVKLLNAIPLKNPQIDSHTIKDVHPVCSAKTKKKRVFYKIFN